MERTLGMGPHDRDPGVPAFADLGFKRNVPEERDLQDLRHFFTAPFSKNRARHILHDPQDRDLKLAEHIHRAPHIRQSNLLRRGNDHDARQEYPLRQRQLNVSRARRQVHHKIIQRSPVDTAKELLDHLKVSQNLESVIITADLPESLFKKSAKKE